MQTKQHIYKLKGKVQHYAWGGFTYIPQLLGMENNANKPFAEYWMGAHPSASSEIMLEEGQSAPLFDIIQQNAPAYIGAKVNNEFGELPYLLKILDVNEMLSIQVHPTKEEARKGFEREEAEGIPINAPHRNYKDKNHKPEVMVALSEFWLLHGFKKEDELKSVLSGIPEFNFLLPILEKEGYYGLYKTVMELEQDKVDEVLAPLLKRIVAEPSAFTKRDAEYWVIKMIKDSDELTGIDRGIFSIYFFNIMQVQPGEAVFQGAGIPHAYLEGQNVELMANSDNVLRGGLTPKHVDVPELLKHTLFQAVDPVVLTGEQQPDGALNYPCPVNDFGISAVNLEPGTSYASASQSAEIFIVIEGEATVNPANLNLSKGEAFVVFAATTYKIQSKQGCIMYKAFVP